MDYLYTDEYEEDFDCLTSVDIEWVELTRREVRRPWCDDIGDDGGFVCSRHPGHDGPHVGIYGEGEEIRNDFCAIWGRRLTRPLPEVTQDDIDDVIASISRSARSHHG